MEVGFFNCFHLLDNFIWSNWKFCGTKFQKKFGATQHYLFSELWDDTQWSDCNATQFSFKNMQVKGFLITPNQQLSDRFYRNNYRFKFVVDWNSYKENWQKFKKLLLDLAGFIIFEWLILPPRLLQKRIKSIPRRVTLSITNHGGLGGYQFYSHI